MIKDKHMFKCFIDRDFLCYFKENGMDYYISWKSKLNISKNIKFKKIDCKTGYKIILLFHYKENGMDYYISWKSRWIIILVENLN